MTSPIPRAGAAVLPSAAHPAPHTMHTDGLFVMVSQSKGRQPPASGTRRLHEPNAQTCRKGRRTRLNSCVKGHQDAGSQEVARVWMRAGSGVTGGLTRSLKLFRMLRTNALKSLVLLSLDG